MKYLQILTNKLIYLPYIVAIIISIIFFWIGYNNLESFWSDILFDLSVSFISIPLIIIFIDSIKNRINNKLRKELFDYAKKNIDNDILTVLANINRFFNLPLLVTGNPLFKAVTVLLGFDKKRVSEEVKKISPLGFQLFKDWGETNKYFSDALQSPMSLKVFKNNQLTILIRLLKSIQRLERDLKDDNNFTLVSSKTKNFRVRKGTDMNLKNVIFPARWILLEETNKKDDYIVRDFGDFDEFFENKLLIRYKLTNNGHKKISKNISEIIYLINQWLLLTGNEFIMDPRRFRGAVIEKTPIKPYKYFEK